MAIEKELTPEERVEIDTMFTQGSDEFDITDKIINLLKEKGMSESDAEEAADDIYDKLTESDFKFKDEIELFFKYGGQPLTFDMLNSQKIDTNKLELRLKKLKITSNIEGKDEDGMITPFNFIMYMAGEMKANPDIGGMLNDNIDNLVTWAGEKQEQKESKEVKSKFRITFAKEVGDLPLGNWSNRKAMYEYWAKIDEKYSKVEEKYGKLPEEIKGELSKPIKYIVKLNPMKLDVPKSWHNALKILKYFSELQGVYEVPKVEEKDSSPESVESDSTVNESEKPNLSTVPQRGTMPDLSTVPQPIPKVVTEADVDPIFHYYYNKDYSKLAIPQGQIDEIKEWIEGKQEEGKGVVAGLKNIGVSQSNINEFDEWFEDFLREAGRDEKDKTTNYFLPISPFVERINDEYKNINTDLDEFFEELDKILEPDEKNRTKFTTYQTSPSGVGRGQGPATTQEAETAATIMYPSQMGSSLEFSAEDDELINNHGDRDAYDKAKKAKDSKKMKELVNEAREKKSKLYDFLDAINEYYLIPVSSPYFVQQKEKPRWVKKHAAMLTSLISGFEEDESGERKPKDPVGSFLRRSLEKGIHAVDVDTLKELTSFIKMARKSGATYWSDKFLREGLEAVEALDDLFGPEWNDKNMQSVGNILFQIKKELDLSDEQLKESISKFPKWEGYIKPLEGSITLNYPLTKLRHILNTPEFTSYLGIGGERDSKTNKPIYGISDDLIQAYKELDKEFDDFHKADEINLSMLQAHDIIRKMNNETIVKARLSLNSITDMDLVINKLHKEKKMDLTSMEVNKIVKAVSSYQSIASDFGINEDAVYTIKALFR